MVAIAPRHAPTAETTSMRKCFQGGNGLQIRQKFGQQRRQPDLGTPTHEARNKGAELAFALPAVNAS
jgi:hypothetical protein